MPERTRAAVDAAAEAADIHFTTVYDWLRLWDSARGLDALIPRPPGRRKGTKLVEDRLATKTIRHQMERQARTERAQAEAEARQAGTGADAARSALHDPLDDLCSQPVGRFDEVVFDPRARKG